MSPWRTETFRLLNQTLDEAVGFRTAQAFESLGLRTVDDLMHHLPRRYLSGTETTDLTTVRPGDSVAIVARVARLERHGEEPKLRLACQLTDGRGQLSVTFFGRKRLVTFWAAELSKGVKGIFVGKVGAFRGELQMTHPVFVMLDEHGNIVGRSNEEKSLMAAQVSRSGLVGIYPATSKLPTWQIAECAGLVLDLLAGLDDPLPSGIRDSHDLPGLLEAFTEIHRPSTQQLVDRAVKRLKFDEALMLQLTMAYRRADRVHHRSAPVRRRTGGLLDAFDARLPFTLTQGQQEVSAQIFEDLAEDIPMQRLLQGEVGSGKTVVALRAMLAEVDDGRQAALLAPTEVLATQHAESVLGLLGELGQGQLLGAPEYATDVVLLTGSMPAAARRQALAKIADGQAGIVIGTHALLSEAVSFSDLGLVVIDEQHRFGVEQRAALTGKGKLHPHVLVMTATPIPRSVAMTVFGDLETSTLVEIPAGRQDVQTTVVSTRLHPRWVDRAWQRVAEEVAAGRQAFVVCPRISPSEADVAPDDDTEWAPSATVEELAKTLGGGPLQHLRLGVLHGRMKSDEKSAVMAQFVAGQLDVLVSTTVIEVGVDVPNASAMVVMDADRFGISQLHQLRGRIGRGEHPGICLLVTSAPADSAAADRLAAVAATRDGFELAEVDLAQRREGNVLGASQSGGKSSLKLLRVLDDADLIQVARELAERLVVDDPNRADPRLADMVTRTELDAAGDWLEKS